MVYRNVPNYRLLRRPEFHRAAARYCYSLPIADTIAIVNSNIDNDAHRYCSSNADVKPGADANA